MAANTTWSRLSMGEKFRIGWREYGPEGTDDQIVLEYKFHPDRAWRFDAAFPKVKVGIEFDGMYGYSHSAAWKIRNDKEKRNAAASMGWKVFSYESAMLSKVQLPGLISQVVDALSPPGSCFCSKCGSIYVPDDFSLEAEEDEETDIEEAGEGLGEILPIGKSPYQSSRVQKQMVELPKMQSKRSVQKKSLSKR